MNKEDLLQNYFDNNLSDEGRNEFDKLMENDIEFQQEFKRLELVDKQLNGFAANLTSEDETFIGNTNKKLLKDSRRTNITAKLSRPLYFFILSFLFITAIATILYINRDDTHETVVDNNSTVIQNKSQKSVVVKQREIGVNPSHTISTDGDKKESVEKVKTKFNEGQNMPVAENLTDAAKDSKGKIKGNIYDKNPVRNQEIITQLLRELEEYRNAGDVLNETWTLKRLGIFYRQLGDYSKSNDYLNQSLELSMRIPDEILKADIFAEIAYLNFVQGSVNKATDYKEKCLKILQQSLPARAEYWQKKFSKFQQK